VHGGDGEGSGSGSSSGGSTSGSGPVVAGGAGGNKSAGVVGRGQVGGVLLGAAVVLGFGFQVL